jgi:hypothetical protein
MARRDCCGGKDAVKYIREEKQMTTTSSVVLIPAQYLSAWFDLIRAQSARSQWQAIIAP